jgi:hypothetical protein
MSELKDTGFVIPTLIMINAIFFCFMAAPDNNFNIYSHFVRGIFEQRKRCITIDSDTAGTGCVPVM